MVVANYHQILSVFNAMLFVSSSPRFLVEPIHFCIPFCPLSCPYGFVPTSSDCFNCQCNPPTPYTTPSATPQSTYAAKPSVSPVGTLMTILYSSLSSIFVTPKITPAPTLTMRPLTNPCDPTSRYCGLICTVGFQTMATGCQMCACVTSISPVHSLIASTTSNAITQSSYMTSLPPSSFRTILHTVTSPSTSSYIDPCIHSQSTCGKSCPDGYVKGPENCQYCFCMSRIPDSFKSTTLTPATTAATTTTVALTYPGPRNPNTSVKPAQLSGVCYTAQIICQTKCSEGFQFNAGSCLHCVCEKTRDPPNFLVKLPNPCVDGVDQCHLRCLSGYILGRDGCQFCSCL